MSTHYAVSVSLVVPRRLLAVRALLRTEELSIQIPALLGKVYQSVGPEQLDGQNVVVYRGRGPVFEVEIGVGLKGQVEPAEGLVVTQTPAGEAAHTTHWGSYAGLQGAYNAILAWCMSNERGMAGASWEVYGHMGDDPAKVQTDVYILLTPP